MRFRTPKTWGSMPPDLPRVKDCRVAMFSTSAYDIGKVLYGPVNEVCCTFVASSLQHYHLVIENFVTSALSLYMVKGVPVSNMSSRGQALLDIIQVSSICG